MEPNAAVGTKLKRFYTAEEAAPISVADIPWHENGSDVSDDS